MSICTRINCPRGTQTAHVLSKGKGSTCGKGHSEDGKFGGYSGWDSAESVGGCGVFYYSWDSFEEIEDYGERPVSLNIMCVDYNS